ncbi:type II toxin-antitoxin system VapC family toxin [Cryobacterium sp. PH31-O1]|uniref:type II toxin-antitoxin system VapC family toxin n=1 Tax=Cryobacterium sp. PH31-O1 TaxID=3046306 RepID=UPI0024BB36A9|nr:type II toxin-antitoxin system VapC family toxin [Cryobacterium sp. PH31-O1]MDJ0339702.1 type II toxin-antitoxin system VapC family toxin [Cryobacterium sp. PH31-O1]
MTILALDTSVAVPLLVASHQAHRAVVDWWQGREVALAGHALAETYSVLTRLPGDARLDPGSAARLLASRFVAPVLMTAATAGRLPTILGDLGIAGGAVYDALVALAAQENDCVLATRDSRAKATYDAVGVRVEIVGR